MLNLSVNVDDRLLDIGNNPTNEIESIFELLTVSLLGDDFAMADNNELNEEKSSVISYFDNSRTPLIPNGSFFQNNDIFTISHNDLVVGVVSEITPPPPKC